MLYDNRPKPDLEPRKPVAERGAEVEVTLHDILQGQPEDPMSCMVAMALERTFGGEWHVVPGEYCGDVYTNLGPLVRGFKIPTDVYAKIRAFDKGQPVEPFTFKLGRATS